MIYIPPEVEPNLDLNIASFLDLKSKWLTSLTPWAQSPE